MSKIRLYYVIVFISKQNIEEYQKILPDLLTASSLQRPLVIILDGLDQVREYSSTNTAWIPTKLPDNIKLIISVTEGMFVIN